MTNTTHLGTKKNRSLLNPNPNSKIRATVTLTLTLTLTLTQGSSLLFPPNGQAIFPGNLLQM